jgi:hypothetical protein
MLQHAEHPQFGSISYEARRLWTLHGQIARSGYIQLRQHHERVLRVPLASSGDRMLMQRDTPDLTLLVYVAGTQMILNTVLTMQHFCQEIEHVTSAALRESDIGARTREAFCAAGLAVDTAQDPGYSALREIVEKRDAIEHPKRKNTFNSHPTEWDQVPLNWFLTERAPRAFERWSAWFVQAVEQWNQHPAMQPRMLTLTIGAHGVKSTRQAKKPPVQ